MDIVKKTQTTTLKAVASLEYLDLGNDLAAYRLTKESSPESAPPTLLADASTHAEKEGLARLSLLEEHLAGKSLFPENAPNIGLFPKDFPKLAAQFGYSEGREKAGKADPDFESSRPFSMLVSGKATVDQLQLVDVARELLFDRDGKILPVGIPFEYIMAGMHNARYDLELALEILKKNDRVRFLDHYGYPANPPKILTIPGYNATDHQTRYLHFVLEPTADEMQRLWERQLSYDSRHPTTEVYRAEFELDILGLRQGGAALFMYPGQSLDNTGR